MMNIIVISLKRAKERRERIKNQLQELNLDAIILDAIDGNDLSESQKDIYINNSLDIMQFRHKEKFKPGEIGCILSTINAIKYAKENNWQYAILMDDDIVISKSFKKGIDYILKTIPHNWQHVFLGGHTHLVYPPLIQPALVPTKFKVSGSYCYIIKNDIYDILINNLNNFDLPVDDKIQYTIFENNLKSYMFYPFLAYPIQEYSYIWDIYTPNNIHSSVKYFKDYF